ncbi:hypothetical protein JHK86_020734 [Glycine max]|nr:hypothetical protein JHK86_020734 [Glycine max]
MEKGRTVVVSALQFACTDDISTNVATAERLVRAAHKQGANIILIQELFEGYYFCQAQREDFIQRAKPHKDHPTILRMQKLAKELGVVIPVSFFEEANNAHYNSIAIIDADGTDLGIYRKSHIPDGPAICWDQWFPEAARAMVLQGAEILFYPTAIGSEPQDGSIDSRDHWKRVMQGHAGANLVPLVASNRIGKEIIETEHGKSEITFYGNSFIAGPTGEIISTADDKDEAVLIAQFDLDKIKSMRHCWGVFRDRRPDLYKLRSTLDISMDQIYIYNNTKMPGSGIQIDSCTRASQMGRDVPTTQKGDSCSIVGSTDLLRDFPHIQLLSPASTTLRKPRVRRLRFRHPSGAHLPLSHSRVHLRAAHTRAPHARDAACTAVALKKCFTVRFVQLRAVVAVDSDPRQR